MAKESLVRLHSGGTVADHRQASGRPSCTGDCFPRSPYNNHTDRLASSIVTSSSDRFAKLLEVPAKAEDFKDNTIRSGAYALGGEAADFALRLGSLVILARLLLPEHFGLLSMVTAITAIGERFKDLGLMSATIQSPSLNHRQSSTLFWVNATIGAALMIVISALAYPIAYFYHDSRLAYITIAIASTFLWSGAANQHHALLRRSMRYRTIAILQLTASAGSIAIAVILAVKGLGYWALVAREVTRSALLSAGAWLSFPWIPGLPSNLKEVRRMLRFGVDITAVNVLHLFTQGLDQILIGKVFGPEKLGFYRQGYQLALAPLSQISYPIRVVAESALSRLQDDATRYRNYYHSIVKTVTIGTLPLGLFMTVYAEEIVTVALGQRWLPAAPVFGILGLASCLRPAAETAGAVMVSRGLSRRFLWLGLLSAASFTILVFACLPFGTEGVAFAHLLSLWLLLGPKLHWSFKATPIRVRDFFAALAKPAVASLTMSVFLILLKAYAFAGAARLSLALGAVLAPVVFLLTLVSLPGGTPEVFNLGRDLAAALFGGAIRKPSSRADDGCIAK